jgi:CRP-like cAMP-binding protein
MDDDLEALSSIKIKHEYAAAGTKLLRPGDGQFRLFSLFSGWGVQFRVLPDGRRQILDILLPGDLIGLGALLRGRNDTHVQALTDVSYCVLDAQKLLEILAARPSGPLRIAQLADNETARAQQVLCYIGPYDAEERIAHFLLQLYRRLRTRGMIQGHTFALPLTQQHLSEFLGMTVVHANRVLRSLSGREIVTVGYGRVIIHDLAALAELVSLSADVADRAVVV